MKIELKSREMWRRLLSGGIILLGILLDQLAKALASGLLKPVGSVPLWQDVLHLTYVENRGAAFGMLAGQRWIFMVISTVAILAVGAYLFMAKDLSFLSAVALSMIVSGGIGNMIDRVFLGYVVDFIDFTLIDFAVFNGADSFVCVGAGLMVLSLMLEMLRDRKKGETDAKL